MKKVALITGSGQGIGRALAIKFAQDGYAVSLCDTDKDAGLEVIQQVRDFGGTAMFMRVDVADEEAVKRFISLTVKELGQIDVLINNAGIGRGAPFLELTSEDFDRVIAVNLRGTFLCSRESAKVMKAQGSGNIINISSTRAIMSEADTEAYSASKGGILSLTHAMAVSLGPSGIRVNAISPGWIETSDWQHSARATTPSHSEEDRKQHPVGRVGIPYDIADMCLYLSSSQAGFITGQNFVVDGGMTVKMIYE